MASKRSDFGNSASPGKIFIGGLAKETTIDTFVKYFGKYGEITDSVIMKDRATGRPRGFGFITYAHPLVVDTVIAETHVINGKQVEIKRTIPKGSGESKDFKTKKIFVGGIPATVTEDELKIFFSKYGKVYEHEIIRDHVTKRSRGFGFVVFENEQTVDELLVNGYMINMNGAQVEIKKAEPKKPSNTGPPSYNREYKKRKYGDSIEGYSGYAGNSGYGPPPHRSFNGVLSRFSDYGPPPPYRPVASEYSSEYAGYKSNAPPLDGHFSRGAYPFGVGALDWFGPTAKFSHYDGPDGGSSYESGAGSGYSRAGVPYENRAGYSGSSRYNPYGM